MRPFPTAFAVIAVFLLLFAVNTAQAEQKERPADESRVALVIGNAAYPSAPLTNPVNDAADVAAALKKRGFTVLLLQNATKIQMEQAIGQFGEKLVPEGTALLYYSGHGIQANGHNYLIPIDAHINTEAHLRLETLDLDVVVEQMMAARPRVNFVILDACRNNPFERRFRGVSGGLAQISAPEGTLIAYSTAPGKVASDGEGRNGLYTSALLNALDRPGLKAEELFKNVRATVSKSSTGAQIPWESSSLVGDFVFTPGVVTPPPAAVPSEPGQIAAPIRATDPTAVDITFWESIKDSKDTGDMEDYLRQFPDGKFAALAKRRLQHLTQQAATPPKPPAKIAKEKAGNSETQQQAAVESTRPPAAAKPARAPSDSPVHIGMVTEVHPDYGYLVFRRSGAVPPGAPVYVIGSGGNHVTISISRQHGDFISATLSTDAAHTVSVGAQVVAK